MNPNPIAQARAALDRALKGLLAVRVPKFRPDRRSRDDGNFRMAGQEFLLQAHNLVRVIQGNPHLLRASEDCQAAFDRELQPALDARADLLRALGDLRNKFVGAYPRLLERDSYSTDDPYFESAISRFDKKYSAVMNEPAEIDESRDADSSTALFERLRWVLESRPDALSPDKPPSQDEILEWHRELTEIALPAEPVRRELRLLSESHPGSRLKWLLGLVAGLNPELNSIADILSFDGDLVGYGPVIRFLFEPEKLTEDNHRWLATDFREKLANHARVIASDLHSRLATRASAAWVLQRYARRSRRLNLHHLRSLIDDERDTRQKELRLAEDAALFMFDQGFEAVTELPLGQHRYDIVGETLLVEAKIYGVRPQSGIKVLTDALKQVHHYAAAFKSEGVEVEPILLLFRLGGGYIPALPAYRIADLTVAVSTVDIGASHSSGRRAAAPLATIEQEDIGRALAASSSRVVTNAGPQAKSFKRTKSST